MSAVQEKGAAGASAGTGLQALGLFYRFPSPWILTGLVLAAATVRWQLGPAQGSDLLAMAMVLLLWPFYEWAIHVYLLHRPAPAQGGSARLSSVAKAHRAHHANPSELRWIFIPVHVYPVAVPVLALLFWVLTRDPAMAATLLLMELLLSLHYEWVHFLAHVRRQPRSAYYRRRIRQHLLHHFRDERLWWGVTTGIADALLGTAPNPRSVPKSTTTHSLDR